MREAYREYAKNTDVQVAVIDALHGTSLSKPQIEAIINPYRRNASESKDYPSPVCTPGNCKGNLSTCTVSQPCANRTTYQKFMDDEGVEADPSGLAANTPGAKLDAGKVRPALVLGGFARALMEVSKVGTFGANKYTDNGWMEVPNGIGRYTEALSRHQLKEWMGEKLDPDSNLMHAAHAAWNALARLDLMIREDEQEPSV